MPITWGPDAQWPPGDPRLADLFTEYGVWYRGQPSELSNFYRNTTGGVLDVRPSQRAGGLYGFLGRLFWGAPQIGTEGDMERIHVPAASDIAALNADILYAEPPKFTLDGPTPATDRLQEILTRGGAYAAFAEGAELASAYGSTYYRVAVDAEIADHPILEALPPYCALPEWRYGRLAAVTFWRVVPDGRNGVLRHLERHEPGVIYHQLRLGGPDKLGKPVPLASNPEFARFAQLVDDNGAIGTGIPMLDVIHQPNVLPNRECPGEPIGRSDYQGGGIASMQALDEAWSRWMDELRLARHRLIVPREYTRGLGPGKGATFDPDQRIFTAVEELDPQAALQIEATAFTIRTDDYERTCAAAWRNIVRHAGFSADAFGEEASGAQATATEVGQRGARTISTRARKVGYALPALQDSANVITALDALYFSGKGSQAGTTCTVKFPDGVTPDPVKDAQVVQLLDSAKAISLRTKIAMAHPDWDKDEINAEADAIEGEQAAITASAPTDPGAFDAPAPDPAPNDPVAAAPTSTDPAAMNNGRVPAGYVP